jgi:hypothetical protein
MPCGPLQRNRRLFKENYLDRTEVGSFRDLLFKVRRDRSLIQFSINPVQFNDLTEGILTPKFKKFRAGINTGPATDTFVTVNPYLHAFSSLLRTIMGLVWEKGNDADETTIFKGASPSIP